MKSLSRTLRLSVYKLLFEARGLVLALRLLFHLVGAVFARLALDAVVGVVAGDEGEG